MYAVCFHRRSPVKIRYLAGRKKSFRSGNSSCEETHQCSENKDNISYLSLKHYKYVFQSQFLVIAPDNITRFIDLFITSLNHKLDSYASPIPVDAMFLSRSEGNVLLHFPRHCCESVYVGLQQILYFCTNSNNHEYENSRRLNLRKGC